MTIIVNSLTGVRNYGRIVSMVGVASSLKGKDMNPVAHQGKGVYVGHGLNRRGCAGPLWTGFRAVLDIGVFLCL